MKSLFLFLALAMSALGNQQILLVVAEDFDTPKALLQRFEAHEGHSFKPVGDPFAVNIGRNGLGWGLGQDVIAHPEEEPVKMEGDGKAPAGIFRIGKAFGYEDAPSTAMPYKASAPHDICIDDVSSPDYNRIVPINAERPVKSFEWMRRDDALYALGLTVEHNLEQRKNRGSCIFIHVEKGADAPTSGCTSMPQTTLRHLISWLRPDNHPLLVQIPREYCQAVSEQFDGLHCPRASHILEK
jgi:hypothetical protein